MYIVFIFSDYFEHITAYFNAAVYTDTIHAGDAGDMFPTLSV